MVHFVHQREWRAKRPEAPQALAIGGPPPAAEKLVVCKTSSSGNKSSNKTAERRTQKLLSSPIQPIGGGARGKMEIGYMLRYIGFLKEF
jgi:hypothetical protein